MMYVDRQTSAPHLLDHVERALALSVVKGDQSLAGFGKLSVSVQPGTSSQFPVRFDCGHWNPALRRPLFASTIWPACAPGDDLGNLEF
jgi:hypothetical protein